MTTDHPITPPPELLNQWSEAWRQNKPGSEILAEVATQAAHWGADQELEACCEWVEYYAECGISLRDARRPKRPSLAEEASKALDRVPGPGVDLAYLQNWANREAGELLRVTRAALERLQELENNND